MTDLFNTLPDQSIRDKRIAQHYAQREVVVDIPYQTAQQDFLSAPISSAKLRFFLLGLFTILGMLFVRLLYLQIWHGQNYVAVAEDNRLRLEYLPAARGIIFDRTGTPLVHNIPNFTVTITPADLPTEPIIYDSILQQTANALAVSLIGLQQQVVDHAAAFPHQPLTLQEFVPYDQALQLAAQVDSLPGVAVTVLSARQYSDALAYAHVLGYLGKITPDDLHNQLPDDYLLTDRIGQTGVEAVYEANLRGHKGQQRIEVDALGTTQEVVAEEAAQPGANIVLAIDHDLQTTLYQALADTAEQQHLPGGAAVAIDPRDGSVRALVSYPSFDSNAFIQGLSTAAYDTLTTDNRKPLFNKAIAGEYPSGSTFKVVMAAAALQEQVITPEYTINSTGGIQIGQAVFPDWKSGGHGVTAVRKALADSVNTFFYIAGGGIYHLENRSIEGGLGIDRIDTYAARFGLGTQRGIDLPTEATGFVPSRQWKEQSLGEQWYIGDTYNVSIGQGQLLVTPLQVAVYTAAIANNGTIYQPQLAEYFTDQTNQVIATIQPKVEQTNIINSYYLQVVREGMRQAVLDGSARNLATLPFAVAGKTGTAEIAGTDKTHSWFTAFAPYDDPSLVITVLVEEGGEGYAAALPIARAGLEEYF
ncbi:MAG: penicillin-binding protein 2 [Candidatus Kerfeldbacteria bacterium]|nr:penicillin-binding protein 2 [Candidatus Kerfeldbacteria bacterium]